MTFTYGRRGPGGISGTRRRQGKGEQEQRIRKEEEEEEGEDDMQLSEEAESKHEPRTVHEGCPESIQSRMTIQKLEEFVAGFFVKSPGVWGRA